MKKTLTIFIVLVSFVSASMGAANVTRADDTDTTNTQVTSQPSKEEEQTAAQDFVAHYVRDHITVYNGDFSKRNAVSQAGYYQKISLANVVNNLSPYGSNGSPLDDILIYFAASKYVDTLKQLNVNIYRVDQKTKEPIRDNTQLKNTNIADGLYVELTDKDNNVCASKLVPVSIQNQTNQPQEGTITNNSGVNPLADYAIPDSRSNRSVAPDSSWYTDQRQINVNTGEYEYRVSNTEWLTGNVGFKPYGSIGKLSPIILNQYVMPIYQVAGMEDTGATLYDSDGSILNNTLPSGSKWEVTGAATDSNGFTYYQVSTNAYALTYHPYFESIFQHDWSKGPTTTN